MFLLQALRRSAKQPFKIILLTALACLVALAQTPAMAELRFKSGTYGGNICGQSIVLSGGTFTGGVVSTHCAQPNSNSITDNKAVILDRADIESTEPLTIQAPGLVAINSGSLDVNGALKVHSQNVQITADRQTQERSESHTDTGFLGLTSSTSVHREKHDTAVPTRIEAHSVHIKADTLVSEAVQVKASNGIRFDARQWFNYPTQNHHCISDEDSDSGWLSSSHRNHGHCRTETVHTSLNPGAGELTLNIQKVEATVGIQPGQSLDQTLDQLVSKYPDLLWIKKLRNHHYIQWQTIENNYRGWDDETSGISPLLGVIVSAVVTVATQGVGASLLPAAMSTNLIATNAANAAFSTLVAKSAVDLANNGGDIGQTAKQLFSQDTIKTVAVDTIAGGLMGAANTPYLVSPSAPLAQRIQSFGVRIASRTGAGMVVEGGSLQDQFTASLSREAWQELAAQANYWAGDYARSRNWKEGEPAKMALHSSVGAVLGELKDGKPLAGAVAGGTAQATAGLTKDLSHEVQEITATIFAAVAAQLAGGDPQTGAWIGQAQHQYNRELHREEAGFLQKQIEGLDEEQQARWLAAVCAKVHCSQGLSPDDPHYNTFKTLELAGSDCRTELTQLETSELFTYTRKDATEDFLSRYDEGITRFTGIVQTLAGVGSAAGSAAGGSVLCVSGIGCGLGALISSAGITAGIEEYQEGITKLTTEYTTDQGDRVAASFNTDTHPEEQSRVEELGRVAVVAAAELAVARLGLRLSGSQSGGMTERKNKDTARSNDDKASSKDPDKNAIRQGVLRQAVVKSETGGTLIRHENFGGHVIQRHIGKTDEQLSARLAQEPNIKISSSFYDVTTADKAIGETLENNKHTIEKWLDGGRRRLELTYESHSWVGRVVARGATESQPSNKIFVLLEKDPLMPNGYRIHTAYPER